MASFSSSDTNNSNSNNNVNENDTVTTTTSSSSSSPFSFHLVPKPESLTSKRCGKIVKYARKRLQSTSGGNIPTSTTPSIRIITHSQLQLGKLLGEGAFSSVYEIQSVKKKHRDFMVEQQGNIVVKFLRAKLYDNHGLFAASAADIVKEGTILATLCHVNVIRLHAISSSLGVDAYLRGEGRGGGCYHDGYFLVLEKLTQTLTTRIHEWQCRHTQLYTKYNNSILLKQQQQKQQEQQQDNDSVIANTTTPPSVLSWRKRILLNTLRKSGKHNNRRGGSSTSLSLLSSTSDDVSISSIASSAAASYFTSDYLADDDADAADIDVDDHADVIDDADNCGADWNTTTTSTSTNTNTITQDIAQLIEERLDASLQLAEAIHYLTTQNVMHRDLKPDNIGFDSNGVLKVFDFDIARRCVPTDSDSDHEYTTENHTYQYTHKVGSPRYMSPECAKHEKYNMKTDVYSFALLFHQLLTLQKPYDDLDDDEHDQLVFYQGVRPAIPSELPMAIQQLLTRSWSPRISRRPTMRTICRNLKEERKKLIQTGTPPSLVSSSSPSLLSSMSYVSSCSFTAVSDINVSITNKKKNKKKEKEEKKKNTTLFNININSNNTSSSNNNNNNNTKKKNKEQRRRRFLRPSLTLFRRNSGGSSSNGGGNNNDKNNNIVVVPGPTKILKNKLSSSYNHRRRSSHNDSNSITTATTTNAKAA